jgi:hypothetical protein
MFFLGAAVPARAASATPQPPPGFELILEDSGVWLYRKDYTNGTPDYVQVIDLAQGAGMRLLHAPITAERPGRGVYGGSDARLGFNSLAGFWRQLVAAYPQDGKGESAFCVTNGQFFYMPENPTRLALPLKVDGQVLTEGFGYEQYPEKLMLELWSDRADINPLTVETLYASGAPDILGGLPEDANKRAPYAVGRTFIGVDDWDGDGSFEVIYLFATPTASQGAVAQVLRDFGAKKVMMLDGGGSTQLICHGNSYISSDRLIPQAIAVLAAPPPPVSGQSPAQALHLTLAQDENIELTFALQNTGIETWMPGQHHFVLESNPLSSQRSIDFEQPVAPGETVTMTLRLASYSTAGQYPVTLGWHLEREGQAFSGGFLELVIDVLPKGNVFSRSEEPAGRSPAESNILPSPPASDLPLPTAVVPADHQIHSAPIQTELNPVQLNLYDLLLIPLLMLPFFFILMLLIKASQ